MEDRDGRQGNKRALQEKKNGVSVEIALKKLEGYVITNYLYLINVEVSRTINYNFGRHVTDSRPSVDRQIAKTMEKTVGRLLGKIEEQPTFDFNELARG